MTEFSCGENRDSCLGSRLLQPVLMTISHSLLGCFPRVGASLLLHILAEVGTGLVTESLKQRKLCFLCYHDLVGSPTPTSTFWSELHKYDLKHKRMKGPNQ